MYAQIKGGTVDYGYDWFPDYGALSPLVVIRHGVFFTLFSDPAWEIISYMVPLIGTGKKFLFLTAVYKQISIAGNLTTLISFGLNFFQ